MHDLIDVACELQTYLSSKGWRFTFIGGLANLAWGEPRTTRDVDVSIFAAYGAEAEAIEGLLSRYASRIPNAAKFALENRVLLLKSAEGIPIDVALAAFEFESQAIDRSRLVDFGRGTDLTVVSPEDLIVMKAFAGRDQDWADVAGIVARQAGNLDWRAIREHADLLSTAAADPEMVARLRKHEPR